MKTLDLFCFIATYVSAALGKALSKDLRDDLDTLLFVIEV